MVASDQVGLNSLGRENHNEQHDLIGHFADTSTGLCICRLTDCVVHEQSYKFSIFSSIYSIFARGFSNSPISYDHNSVIEWRSFYTIPRIENRKVRHAKNGYGAKGKGELVITTNFISEVNTSSSSE